jgi:hypothetical protein
MDDLTDDELRALVTQLENALDEDHDADAAECGCEDCIERMRAVYLCRSALLKLQDRLEHVA